MGGYFFILQILKIVHILSIYFILYWYFSVKSVPKLEIFISGIKLYRENLPLSLSKLIELLISLTGFLPPESCYPSYSKVGVPYANELFSKVTFFSGSFGNV